MTISAEGWIAIVGIAITLIGSYGGIIWWLRGQFSEVKEELAGVRIELAHHSHNTGRLEAANDKEHEIIWNKLNSHTESLERHGQEIAVLKSNSRNSN